MIEINKTTAFVGISVLAIIIIILIKTNNNNKKLSETLNMKDSEIDKLKKHNLEVWKELAKNTENITPKIKELILYFGQDYKEVKEELEEILELAKNQHHKAALSKLTKIIENLLEEKYKGNDEKIKETILKKANKKVKKISLYHLTLFAKLDNFFTDKEYHSLKVLQSVRNKEAHEIKPDITKQDIEFSFITGINIIYKLKKESKKQTA